MNQITIWLVVFLIVWAFLHWTRPEPREPRDRSKERCDGCVFYRDNNVEGRCRRFPPNIHGVVPVVYAGGWCGEFKPLPPPCAHDFSVDGRQCSRCGEGL